MPIEQYVPDQFELARRHLVEATPQDGSVNVADVGGQPFLYGRAKPQTPLEQQMARERRRQQIEQQRYDQTYAELTSLPQWMADRMDPAAVMETRRRGAETAGRLPLPGGTPLSDAYAGSEQDLANIPRVGAAQRSETGLNADAAAQTWMNPTQTQRRSMERAETLPQQIHQQTQANQFGLVRELLQGLFNSQYDRPDLAKINSILDLVGMSVDAPPADAGADGGAGVGDALTGGGGITLQQLQEMADAEGITLEEAMEEARSMGLYR